MACDPLTACKYLVYWGYTEEFGSLDNCVLRRHARDPARTVQCYVFGARQVGKVITIVINIIIRAAYVVH